MPYGLLGSGRRLWRFHRPMLGAPLLLWSWASRVASRYSGRRAGSGEPRLGQTALLYPLRDLLGLSYWVASYVSNQVRWRGEVYNLLEDGPMRNDSQSAKREPEAILTT